jgi:UDPglucose 6-dehydrogenase
MARRELVWRRSLTEEFNVGVVGAGYVGLVTGACLAHVGHRVVCADRDEGHVAELREGRMPIYEPDLEELVADGARRGRLSFSTDLPEVVHGADVVFIAVDTPQDEDGSADLSSVGAVARSIGRALAEPEGGTRREQPLVVVNKSTVPVGSGDYVSMLVQEGAAEGGSSEEGAATAVVDYRVVSNPEFLREGSAVYDSFFPNRIVLGAEKRDALDKMRALYEPIIEQTFPTRRDPRPRVAVPFVTTDLASAEMIKYAANAFLATKISFINEISTICELVGADVTSVAHGMGLDDRIGSRFLSAGIGWGGIVLPQGRLRPALDRPRVRPRASPLDATVSVNERQRKRVISKLQRTCTPSKASGEPCWGSAFKPNTDDLREAPCLEIARELEKRGGAGGGLRSGGGQEGRRALGEPQGRLRPLRGAGRGPRGGGGDRVGGVPGALTLSAWLHR